MTGAPVRLSVVIPTRDRPADLDRCVDSLGRQDAGGPAMEVVVVDDGSREGPPAPAPGSARILRTPPRGANAARNAGVAAATGEIVAFLDDDATVEPGWAAALVSAFDRSGCQAVGGRITLSLPGPPPRWLGPQRALLGELDLGASPRWMTDERLVPVSANCAIARSELERLGGFRDDLDRVGGSLLSNGETELFRRLVRTGGRVRYEPAAHALHWVSPSRLTLDYMRRRAHAQGASDEMLSELEGGGGAHSARNAIRFARAAPILAKALARGEGAAGALIWISYCRGRWAGPPPPAPPP